MNLTPVFSVSAATGNGRLADIYQLALLRMLLGTYPIYGGGYGAVSEA